MKYITLVFLLLLSSCVAKSDYEELQQKLENSEKELVDLQKNITFKETRITELKKELKDRHMKIKVLEDQYSKMEDRYKQKKSELESVFNPYDGVWIKIDSEGKLLTDHLIVIDVMDNNDASVVQIDFEKWSGTKHAFTASFEDGEVFWPASPMSFRFTHFKVKDLEKKPSLLDPEESVIKTVTMISVPEAGVNDVFEGMYVKLSRKNWRELN